MRNRLWIVIGIALGVVSVVLVHAYVQGRERSLRSQLLKGQEPTPVLIAVQDIQGNALVKDDMVQVQDRPAYSIQPHALADSADAVGKVALVPLYKGEQVLDSKLARPESATGLAMKTPPGKRAVTISVDAVSGVGGLVKPGDYVDILGVFAVPVPGGEKSVVTLTLLQRVEVLAAGTHLSPVEEDDKEEESHPGYSQVTLALNPQDAQLLLFARAAQAQLQLALRGKTDTAQVAGLTPTTQETLLGIILGPKALEMVQQAQQSIITKGPPKTVEVFRGLEKEVVSLSDGKSPSQ